MAMQHYYNPEGRPEDLPQGDGKRRINIRFKTLEDLELFVKTSGIHITPSVKVYEYKTNTLDC
jgi:hypothetical protein